MSLAKYAHPRVRAPPILDVVFDILWRAIRRFIIDDDQLDLVRRERLPRK